MNKMNCPVCNQGLMAEKYQYLPYHYCKQCGGMWVDAKLLKNLAVRMAVDLNIKPREKKYFQPQKIERPLKDDRIRLCPQCSAGMKQNNYAYDSNVIIDRCDACEGIWLDNGEMMRLAQFHQIDENDVLLGRELIKLKGQNDPDEDSEYSDLIGTAIGALLRAILRF
jgi:Zn-finger nucleic acid-binding protein